MPTPRPEQLEPSPRRRDSYHFTGTPADRPSPLPNRVLPTGDIVAVAERGLLMGNRGCLHTDQRTLGVSRWRSKMWISCVLRWGNLKRDVMPPGRWTALFFLDEATALAAGHRPCGYCRWEDYRAFAHAWQQATGLAERPKAWQLDVVLHRERVNRRREKLTTTVALAELPDGAMVRDGQAFALVAGRQLHPWSWRGYGPGRSLPASTRLLTLTPPAVLAALRCGYRPRVHPSAAETTLPVLPVRSGA